jgi:nitrite reductase/ring-hydroxylating ferredoxin subunit
MAEYYAGNVAEYADGDRRVVICGDTEVGLFKIGEDFYAWHNRCAHRAGPVCQGRIMNRVIEPVAADRTVRAMAYADGDHNIICPWHGYEYSIKTGANQGTARLKLKKADISIRDGELYVRV